MAQRDSRADAGIERARRLRQDQTYPEQRLWYALRDRRFAGVKFRRQVPVGPYVVDFACMNQRLALEVDGRSHDDRAEHDLLRQQYLVGQGWSVLRVTNDDVLQDFESVLLAIKKALEA